MRAKYRVEPMNNAMNVNTPPANNSPANGSRHGLIGANGQVIPGVSFQIIDIGVPVENNNDIEYQGASIILFINDQPQEIHNFTVYLTMDRETEKYYLSIGNREQGVYFQHNGMNLRHILIGPRVQNGGVRRRRRNRATKKMRRSRRRYSRRK